MSSIVEHFASFYCVACVLVCLSLFAFPPVVTGLFVCVEVLQPSQPNGVMSSAVSLPNRTFTGQA